MTRCPFCEGTGLALFEGAGPSVEICSECDGTGRLLSEKRGVFRELMREKGVMLTTEMRLLLVALDELERRLDELERRFDHR